jgi:hypothetical protein
VSDDDRDLAVWIREEAFNFENMLNGELNGEERLDFAIRKKRRDERARTVPGGEA